MNLKPIIPTTLPCPGCGDALKPFAWVERGGKVSDLAYFCAKCQLVTRSDEEEVSIHAPARGATYAAAR